MSLASLIAFGLVFLAASFGWSLLLSSALLVWGRLLRRMGPWVERRAAAAALVLPPLLALGLAGILAVESAVAFSAGKDHCLEHGHHLHLCLKHGASWATQPWALALVVCAATFVGLRFALTLWAHGQAQRAVESLRRAGEQLGERACYLVPSTERFAFTAGLVAPTVVLSSAAWDALEPEQREAVVAHELAHVAHGDLWRRAGLGVLASLGAPFLVTRALHLWELSAERICDRHAVLAVGRPTTVASAMLALVRDRPSRQAPAGAVFAAASHVPERVVSVLREEPDGEGRSRRLLLSAVVVSLSFVGGCAVFAEPLHHALETLLG